MKWILIIVAFFLLIFLISNFSSSPDTTASYGSATPTADSDDYTDVNLGSDQTEEDVVTESPTFNGYPCTDDCSGHEAGFDWAEEKGITQDDVDNYSGSSDSFREGMQSYVDEY